MKAKPEAAGECPCPAPGCGEQLQVYKYVERSARPSMFKGKFYGTCPTHGRVIDASNAPSQEHLLSKGEIWGATRPAPALVPKVEAAPKTAPPPTPQPAPPAPKADQVPAVVPTPQPARGRWEGWNLWEWLTQSS